MDKLQEQEVTMDMMSPLSNVEFFLLGLATVDARHTFGNAINKESAEVQGNPGQAQENQNIRHVPEDQNLGQVQEDKKLWEVQEDWNLGQVQEDQNARQI